MSAHPRRRRGKRRRPRTNSGIGRSVLETLIILCVFLSSFPFVPSPKLAHVGLIPTADAFKLTDILGETTDLESSTTLSLPEISELRVRDIKRRLSRHHGYGADELARMLDKKELINALAYEEHRQRQKEDEARRRFQLRRSIIVALVAVVLVMFWPLFKTAWEVFAVNTVVYSDRKRHEAATCYEYRSGWGALGILCMFGMDVLSLWLSASVLLSWVMRSKYFFPIPSIPIRPAALLAASTGGNAGALGQYGVNVAPMIITWAFRFISGKLEYWTGKALLKAQKRQRKAEKAARKANGEAPWEKQARREARAKRRAERDAKKQEEAKRAAEAAEVERAERAKEIAKTTERFASNAKNPEPFNPSQEESRAAAAAAAEARLKDTIPTGSSALDELD